jgi:type IV secretory pathway ATPase VirB11/archaellum biosynthesis ATPase
MFDALLGRAGDDSRCACEAAVEDDALVVDAGGCPGGGRLSEAAACRATVVGALTTRDVSSVRTRCSGVVRAYEDDAAALLVAAGRFADAVAFHDERLADRVRTDPLGAAHEATGRAGPVSRLAAETGLAAGAAQASGYEEALSPYVGPTISRSRVATRPPAGAHLVEQRDLRTDATVRIYESDDDAARRYHLEPLDVRLDDGETATLAAAYDHLATGEVQGASRAPGRALRDVAADDEDVERLRPVLEKHTRGYGVFDDVFADPAVSDAFATAPVTENAVWVRADGEAMRTNVRLTRTGAAALASRFRRESGRAFSQANPTLDAAIDASDRGIRVAGVTDPTSDGVAFAFRARDREAWTLPALLDNDTLSPRAGALLSTAVERGAATLVAGPRGAGKTTLVGALLWEIPPTTRTVVIEDTPELPVDALQAAGRNAQRLHSDPDGAGQTPTETLRAALRLGSGALVVGEIRGDEAEALYEAMRVGANDGAVLGTIHGDGGRDVRERVVSDLGVPESSFGATDLLVTVEAAETPAGTDRRVRSVEEITTGDRGETAFATLFERDGDCLVPAGRIDRGNSRLVAALARPTEEYAAVLDAVTAREQWLVDLATGGATGPDRVERARAGRRGADGRPEPRGENDEPETAGPER